MCSYSSHIEGPDDEVRYGLHNISGSEGGTPVEIVPITNLDPQQRPI